MKENKTAVDILDFFKTGYYKNITTGETKNSVLINLGSPDDFALGETFEEAQVLIYDSVEFHFENNELYLIYCDKISNLHSSKNLKKSFEKIFNKTFDINILSLENFIDYFTIEDIYYIIEDETEDNCISIVLQNSNVKFEFYPENENNSEIKILSAFYLGSI